MEDTPEKYEAHVRYQGFATNLTCAWWLVCFMLIVTMLCVQVFVGFYVSCASCQNHPQEATDSPVLFVTT